MSTITIRPAHSGDHARLRALLIASYVEYHDAVPAHVFAAYLADLVDLDRRADFGELLVAEHDGAIVGTATFYADATDDGLSWPASTASVRAVAVHPSARGKGVGQALLEACIERAERQGRRQLCLHTAPFMAAAVRMYEAAGFVRVSAHDVDVAARIPGADDPLVITAYALELTAARVAA